MSVLAHRSYMRAPDRRDHILDCALEVFAKQGFHDASIAAICSRAGIGRGTLYQYFADKGAVLAALLDRIATRVVDAIHRWEPFQLPPDGALTGADAVTFIEARCAQIMKAAFADAATASLILGMARGTNAVRATIDRIDQEVVGVVAAYVRAGVDLGVLRPADPQLVAQLIVGGIEKIVFAALEDGVAIDYPRIAREIGVVLSFGLLSDSLRDPAVTRRLGEPNKGDPTR